jgi:hypothetical protein
VYVTIENLTLKEVEFQELEIQLAEKQMKEMKASIEHKKDVISQSKERLEVKSNHLKHKIRIGLNYV